jgi:uncharacterized protein
VRIRDPIHGVIAVSDFETQVIDSPFYQRLRHVRQLGFGDLAFPGATHTRHAHSLGAMHVASRLFDAMTQEAVLSFETKERFRSAVRLAVLCHDLGHMPLSHASESIAPMKNKLELPSYLLAKTNERASHEDFTAKILLGSSLTELIEKNYGRFKLSPSLVASLVTGIRPPGEAGFQEGGIDWTPALRSIVSGELDADRMDYLLRDSFYTGVNYGRFDLEWILQNISAVQKNGTVVQALSRAAVFAFEDFLLSRYHMFLSVYYHHTSVSHDYMLQRYYQDSPGEFEIPSEMQAFLRCDDLALHLTLRNSKNQWAKRIVERNGFKRVAQFTERDSEYDTKEISKALTEKGIEHFELESRGVLSKYFDEGQIPSLFVIDHASGRLTPIAEYTPLYQRFSTSVRLSRIFARPDQAEMARRIVFQLTQSDIQEIKS